uniref:BRCT domain-containing protein n=1 Tax=Rhizophora mucronata TaxID=61149 RepID=A0A2P2L8B5_RHIMU
MVMGGDGRAQVIDSKGCSRLFLGLSSSTPSFRGLQPFEPMSPAASSFGSETVVRSNGPFSSLVICVTGLSKEARKQVMEATERLGGQYSPNLHPQCTHLVVQSFGRRKFEHALKHGCKNGIFVVTLGWFVDSVKRNVRLSESLYSVKNVGENSVRLDDLNNLVGFSAARNSCFPLANNNGKQCDMTEGAHKHSLEKSFSRSADSILLNNSMYIDLDISHELQKKVYEAATREGATSLDQWFVGCGADYVVCEGASVQRYLGHSNNIVTPMWVLKTAKEKHVQRLVHMSADLARQVGMVLENYQNGTGGEEMCGRNPQDAQSLRNKVTHKERQQIVNYAKNGVRSRRGRRMQTCQMPIRPVSPSRLLDSICWSISEPASAASIYTDSFSSEDIGGQQTPMFFDARGDKRESEAPFTNLTRPLTESEKSELIFKDHFLTILFPVDRFSEMGPSSRTFFCERGFTCLQVLDHIYAFYEENMSASEIEAAIHTDSRHADRLRSLYSSKETAELGYVTFKRVDFIGSRKSFEMLKRVSGDNNSNVYELLTRA